MTTRRRRFTAEFKKKVALEALRGDRTIPFDEGTINQSKYTLKKPSDCPTNQDHLRCQQRSWNAQLPHDIANNIPQQIPRPRHRQ